MGEQTTELIKAPKLAVPAITEPEMTPTNVLASLAKRADMTPDTVAMAEKVMAMIERQEARQAEKEAVGALQKLQGAIGKVKATRSVPGRDGSIRFKYADYEDIYDELKPHLDANGFAWSIVDTVFESNRVYAIGQLRHVSGHKETFRYGVQIGSGPPNATPSQADGSAIAYAKRGCLTSAFNIVTESSEQQDARNLGDSISPAEAKALRDEVKASGGNEESFLRLAQVQVSDQATDNDIVEAYLSIPKALVPTLKEVLRRKKSKA